MYSVRQSLCSKVILLCCLLFQGPLVGAQTMLHKHDYGPVISAGVWYGSRLPGLTCSMPKAEQISVPICPDCVVIDVRPHVQDPTLVKLELSSNETLAELVLFFGQFPQMSIASVVSGGGTVFLASENLSELSKAAFQQAIEIKPYVSVSEVTSQSGQSRSVVLVTEHDPSYACVFDHNG